MLFRGISRGWAATAVLFLLVGGCTLFQKPPPGPCPRVSVLGDAAKLVLFRPGPGRDLIDIEFEGEITPLGGGCNYVDRNRVIEMRLELRIAALRGPAAVGPTVEFPYFVAIVGPDQTILVKQVFRSPIAFEKNRRRAGALEQTDQTIPMQAGQTGSDFEVLIGFQLTAAQLDYNRQQRRF